MEFSAPWSKVLLCNSKIVFFSNPHLNFSNHPCLTLHNKRSDLIHMQYVIIACFIKIKIKNGLYGIFSRTTFPLHKI